MISGKRILSVAVVGSLCATAALAIAILLFSEFGGTQARILGTTALIALSGLLALPAGILFDQGRLPRLATAVLALTLAAFALALAGIWASSPPAQLGKAIGTAMAFTLASAQTAALAARRKEGDPRAVRRLFAVSLALALVLASMVTLATWAEINRELYFRVLGALAVADVLAVALQPILARLRAPRTARVQRLRLLVEPGGELEVELEAPSFAAAVEKAVTATERQGHRVLRIERVEQSEDGPRPAEATRRLRSRRASAHR